MGKNQHVVPYEGKWAVRGEGNERVTGVFRTQHEAIERAREIARNQRSELLIYGPDGTIRERDNRASEWLTIDEACAYLKVTRATLYRWARQGRLRLYKLGARATRVRRSYLDRMAFPKDFPQREAWTRLSEASFARDWDNEKDAVYDNWRELYDAREGQRVGQPERTL